MVHRRSSRHMGTTAAAGAAAASTAMLLLFFLLVASLHIAWAQDEQHHLQPSSDTDTSSKAASSLLVADATADDNDGSPQAAPADAAAAVTAELLTADPSVGRVAAASAAGDLLNTPGLSCLFGDPPESEYEGTTGWECRPYNPKQDDDYGPGFDPDDKFPYYEDEANNVTNPFHFVRACETTCLDNEPPDYYGTPKIYCGCGSGWSRVYAKCSKPPQSRKCPSPPTEALPGAVAMPPSSYWRPENCSGSVESGFTYCSAPCSAILNNPQAVGAYRTHCLCEGQGCNSTTTGASSPGTWQKAQGSCSLRPPVSYPGCKTPPKHSDVVADWTASSCSGLPGGTGYHVCTARCPADAQPSSTGYFSCCMDAGDNSWSTASGTCKPGPGACALSPAATVQLPANSIGWSSIRCKNTSAITGSAMTHRPREEFYTECTVKCKPSYKTWASGDPKVWCTWGEGLWSRFWGACDPPSRGLCSRWPAVKAPVHSTGWKCQFEGKGALTVWLCRSNCTHGFVGKPLFPPMTGCYPKDGKWSKVAGSCQRSCD